MLFAAMHVSLVGRYCCKSRFSPMTKILRAAGATFAHNMRGTSRPHAKFTGDFGNAIEVIRITDRSLLSVFAKNLEPYNFRLLQHNRPLAEQDQAIFMSAIDVDRTRGLLAPSAARDLSGSCYRAPCGPASLLLI